MLTVIDGVDRSRARTFAGGPGGLLGVVKPTGRGFGCSSASSSSSSIGKNSDDEEGGENEVESPYKGPLDMMDSLEEVLPIRRGISNFYKGKSKSFSNLKEAESTPIKDLGKPENLYSRRRKNLLSHKISSRGGIAKKPVKTALTLAMTSISKRESDDEYSSSSETPRKPKHHPPLHPRQTKGSFGNCVPVLDSPAARRNIHNIIC